MCSLPLSPGLPGWPGLPGNPCMPGDPCSPCGPGAPGRPGSPGGPAMVRVETDWLGIWFRIELYLAIWPVRKKSHNFQVAVENLVQQSLNRVLAGSQGCGLSCFGIMKLCACWGRNSRLGKAQKIEELLCKIYFLTFVRVLGAFVFYIYKNLKLLQQKLLYSVIAWRQFQVFFRWLMQISSSWT